MTIQQFIEQLTASPESVSFDDTMAMIDQFYVFTETAFSNGSVNNKAGQNNGSCKVLALGQTLDLSVEQTLQCFGDYYRKDVLVHPDRDDHQNIRAFAVHGWSGVSFSGLPLKVRSQSDSIV